MPRIPKLHQFPRREDIHIPNLHDDWKSSTLVGWWVYWEEPIGREQHIGKYRAYVSSAYADNETTARRRVRIWYRIPLTTVMRVEKVCKSEV